MIKIPLKLMATDYRNNIRAQSESQLMSGEPFPSDNNTTERLDEAYNTTPSEEPQETISTQTPSNSEGKPSNTVTETTPPQYAEKIPEEGEDQISQVSYISILDDLHRFKSAKADSNIFDFPGYMFFKILFHFKNGTDSSAGEPTSSQPGKEAITSTTGFISSDDKMSGLLGPSWLHWVGFDWDGIQQPEHYESLWSESTAWNYLVLNNELQRAKNLERFVELLSNINTYSPWYFQSVKGIDNAIGRDMITSGEFLIKQEREKIQIECLDDSADQRIGSLLDLYRSIVWSWETKREMVPSNLRKFDMTIVAFQMPIKGIHHRRNQTKPLESAILAASKLLIGEKDDTAVVFFDDGNSVLASYKAFEFHGCEIDYNSSKSGWASLDNENGNMNKYTIDIFYDDMFETRFNEYGGYKITDIMNDITANSMSSSMYQAIEKDEPITGITDNTEGGSMQDTGTQTTPDKNTSNESTWLSDDGNDIGVNTEQSITTQQLNGYNVPSIQPYTKKLKIFKSKAVGNIYGDKKDRSSSIVGQIVGAVKGWASTQIKKIYLGNISGLSLSEIRQQLGEVAKGNLGATVDNVANYIRGDYNGHGKSNTLRGSDLFPDPIPASKKLLGNIFKSNTVLNS